VRRKPPAAKTRKQDDRKRKSSEFEDTWPVSQVRELLRDTFAALKNGILTREQFDYCLNTTMLKRQRVDTDDDDE
jgi:hypothetical protein